MEEEKVAMESNASTTVPIALKIAFKEELADANDTETVTQEFLKGWKLHFLTISLCLSVFLSTLEISIVVTSLESITDNLNGFGQASWIVTAYLLTYTGFLIIWAKTSDILSRKRCIIAAIIVFVLASGGCGAAQTILQLIVLRAFQGIGGGGIMSLTFVIFPEMVPTEKYGAYSSMLASVFAIAYLIGPLVGGAINDSATSSWRWVFLLNVPLGFIALAMLFVAMPSGFPSSLAKSFRSLIPRGNPFSKIDFLGFSLLLGASVFLITALEEAGTYYAWSSPIIIVFLVISGLSWIGFFAAEYIISRSSIAQEPVFTWEFLQNRIFMGTLLIDILAGVPMYVALIQIPQRFQTVNGTSTLEAGIRLLPFALTTPISSVLATIAASRLQVPPIFILFLGAILQTVGTALLSTSSITVGPATYGYETILGVGLGLNIGTVILLTPNLIRGKHQSVAMGAIMQFRALGGAIGLAIVTNILNNYLKSKLSIVLSPAQLAGLLETSAVIKTFTPTLQRAVQTVYSEGYNLQMKVLTGFGAAQILGLVVMWEKPVRRVFK